MKTLWGYLGIAAYWCSWQALWVYLRGSTRTRVVLRYEGKILVVQPWLGNGSWALPGGGMHAGEPAEIGARREINEELHLQDTKLKLKPLAIEPHIGRDFSYMCHYFMTDLATAPTLQKQRIEILNYDWLEPSELTSANANPDTRRAIELLEEHQGR